MDSAKGEVRLLDWQLYPKLITDPSVMLLCWPLSQLAHNSPTREWEEGVRSTLKCVVGVMHVTYSNHTSLSNPTMYTNQTTLATKAQLNCPLFCKAAWILREPVSCGGVAFKLQASIPAGPFCDHFWTAYLQWIVNAETAGNWSVAKLWIQK